ncbi:MAG TPA: beta-galactosidase GalB, partial [Candidatus Paceibacterota bacterium]|nr:beta-galactosidase GalB [Candidatus Paceibacterota bacterium]
MGNRMFRRPGFRFSIWLCSAIVAGLLPSELDSSAEPASTPVSRERISFNAGWRFSKGESTNDVSCAQPDFPDASWRKLDLPHDWGIEGPFRQELPGETAKLPYAGVGWYRKHFEMSPEDSDKKIFLQIDGAMSHTTVWLNGKPVGGWPYGYTSFELDLTPLVRFGLENVLAIRLDNPPDSSRWYPGGGIYRNVWLVRTPAVHVKSDDVTIATREVRPDSATVDFKIAVANDSASPVDLAGKAIIRKLKVDGSKGRIVGEGQFALYLEPGSSRIAESRVDLPKPGLWSPGRPNLYAAEIQLMRQTSINRDSTELDGFETTFGVRTIQFTATNGFLLNGERFPIKGVCLHHDLGALGAAFNERALERQLQLLRELGCNAIRTAHNPPAPELLDLCDRMGFVVMDEAFDAWRLAKRANDYHTLFDEWYEKDLRAFVRRDRNHPSVVLWSIGNEIYEQRDGANAPLAVQLAGIVHKEDSTRPVNMALHIVAASTNGFQRAVDVFGYNYTPFGYATFHTDNPGIPLIGSETSSCVSSRGEYFFPVSDNKRDGRANFQVTSYDLSAPSWAMPPEVEFKAQDENPFVAGEFVWTGFDYLGEPTPFDSDTTNRLKFTDPVLQAQAERDLAGLGKIRVPSRSSYFGIFDLCGFRKDRFYLYQARWRSDFPMAHILPHWNWPERIGQITPVHVYTSGDEAELFLNGESLGRKRKGRYEYRLRWDDVIYQPGQLTVVA